MKRIFVGFIFFLFVGLAQAQVKMEITGLEIAKDISDHVSSGLFLSYSNPRIKLRLEITNPGIGDITFFKRRSNEEIDATYYYKRKSRTARCRYVDDMGTQVLLSEETMEVFLTFQLPEPFPQENYMEAFFDILPTLRIKLTKMEDEKELWTIFSEPIDWGRISVRNTENDLII